MQLFGPPGVVFSYPVIIKSMKHMLYRVAIYCLRSEQPPERVSLWVGLMGQTTACIFVKHQRKWLCSAAVSPVTGRTLQDHLHHPTPAKVSTCGL
jgi:hypothetical protein